MTSVPVLFIHGFADVSGLWRKLGAFLQRSGIPTVFFNYPTFRNQPDVPKLAGDLAEFVDRHLPQGPFQILAHSQGGLIAEWYDLFMHNHRLHRIVTLATPFHGSMLAALPPRFFVDHVPAGREQLKGLATFSPLIQSLVAERQRTPHTTPYVNFIGRSKRMFGLDSDLVLLTVEAHRNADYYFLNGHSPGRRLRDESAHCHVVRKSHWPASYVRGLEQKDNTFVPMLLRAIGTARKERTHDIPDHCALVYPVALHRGLRIPDVLLTRKTADNHYAVAILHAADGATIFPAGQPLQLRPGRFTYILETPRPRV